jgi:hypothetical protein
METEKDKRLWRLAKKRAGFKNHFSTYLAVNIMLWVLWYFTKGGDAEDIDMFPWPAWCSLGWGIGLTFNFIDAYVSTGTDAIEKEYNKLKNKE